MGWLELDLAGKSIGSPGSPKSSHPKVCRRRSWEQLNYASGKLGK
jgi:hypothetical protein